MINEGALLGSSALLEEIPSLLINYLLVKIAGEKGVKTTIIPSSFLLHFRRTIQDIITEEQAWLGMTSSFPTRLFRLYCFEFLPVAYLQCKASQRKLYAVYLVLSQFAYSIDVKEYVDNKKALGQHPSAFCLRWYTTRVSTNRYTAL